MAEPTEPIAIKQPVGQRGVWTSGGVKIEIVENTITLADLDALVGELQPEFQNVDISRRIAGPMASALIEAAIILTFLRVADGFFAEFGKDIYKELREALLQAYR